MGPLEGVELLERTLAMMGFFSYVTFFSRFLLPALALVILTRCVTSLLRETQEPEVWGYLSLPNASRVALYHWENVIGRAKSADVVLNYPSISRSHLALMRDDKARWTAIDLGSKGGLTVNGARVEGQASVKKGDVLGLGGVELALLDLRLEELGAQSLQRTKPGRSIWPSGTFFFISLFQLVLILQLSIANIQRFTLQIPLSFLALCGMMWAYFFLVRLSGRRGFEVESLAFFLSTIGLSVIASRRPEDLFTTTMFIFAGLVLFVIICFILRDLQRAKLLRWPIIIGGIAFLAMGFLLAEELHGAQRWITIGGFTIQPSEFVKIAFIFAGAATLERLFARKNLYTFIAYSGLCVGILALMNDFGSAAVFFAAFLMISFLRSGDFSTIALSLAALVFAGFLALRIRPHVAARFANWGNVWADPWGTGFQQTRTMSSVASGGLFGLGAGNGVLKDVVAADTDMVFGIVAEELGLIVAFICIIAVVILALFAIRSSATARSSFYVIAAGAAVTMFLSQIILNVFGSLDVIPFTGITFPFLSRGGSSMVASWGLLAFIKAADTRQNASLAIKLDRKAKRAAVREGYGDGGFYDGEDDDGYTEEEDYDFSHSFEEEYEDPGEAAEPLEGGIDPQFFWDEEDGW